MFKDIDQLFTFTLIVPIICITAILIAFVINAPDEFFLNEKQLDAYINRIEIEKEGE